MKLYSILKNLADISNNIRVCGSINPSSSMTFNIPSSHFFLIVLHGVYTSQTAIIEAYVNSSGTSYARIMAVPETAQSRDFTVTTSTNSITVSNTHSTGYITAVHLIGIDVKNITLS